MSHPKPFTLKRHLRRHGIWWAVVIFILILAGGFALGYRVGPGLSIVKAGTLVLADLPPSSSVYVDTKLRATVRNGGEYRTRLTPGTHTVIVDTLDKTPWQDGVTILPGQVTTKQPVLILREVKTISLKAELKAPALAKIAATKLPTEAAPLVAGCANLYIANNRLMGKAVPGCETPPEFLCTAGECGTTELFAPVQPITSLILMPNRTDTVLFTVGDVIYVMDIDPRDPRFFAPLMRAVEPRLGLGTDNTVLLKDIDGLAYTLTLQ